MYAFNAVYWGGRGRARRSARGGDRRTSVAEWLKRASRTVRRPKRTVREAGCYTYINNGVAPAMQSPSVFASSARKPASASAPVMHRSGASDASDGLQPSDATWTHQMHQLCIQSVFSLVPVFSSNPQSNLDAQSPGAATSVNKNNRLNCSVIVNCDTMKLFFRLSLL